MPYGRALMGSRRAAALLLSVFAGACGPAATGLSGSSTVGGPPGSACNPTYAHQGCYAAQPVACEPGANAWKALPPCPAGASCVELPDPASPTSAKRVASCQATPGQDAAGPADVADTTSADLGPEVDTAVVSLCGNLACDEAESAASCPVDCIEKLRDTLICINGACDQAWTACAKQSLCLKAMNCVALCPNDGCIADCESLLGDGKAEFDKVVACTQCDGAD